MIEPIIHCPFCHQQLELSVCCEYDDDKEHTAGDVTYEYTHLCVDGPVVKATVEVPVRIIEHSCTCDGIIPRLDCEKHKRLPGAC